MGKQVAVTGKTGFIGSHLPEDFRAVDLRKPENDWNFFGCETLIHLVGASHRVFTESEYKFINVDLTKNVARNAIASGVKRIVYISSMNVTWAEAGILPNDIATKTKKEAEDSLLELCNANNVNLFIIRAPLVYGKGAPGNFASLMRIASKNLPLPLGSINNKRSFVSVDNLIDLIILCVECQESSASIFYVSDDQDVSTTEFLSELISSAGNTPRLIPFPVSLLLFFARLVGKKSEVERLSKSLTVDIEHTKKTLNWVPPITLDEGIRRCFK
ncbi:NAD-dependent epimerase/dehydratase family protein [Pseudoalteromonas sp. JBTF-M23]|uniref:NAD-dependent epimerase/dehydratase family protein n=1 Tax=Pseudoalteromonas caenipelagi TaxID=2726988 RepID=A0A849VJ55_9GAMM|nr:NAD-dependent epimerase/dehydratase family protein [Pseudoalteromonas caenipelagi]NOU51761.1 NAD-dependent epimerase/dehydratase family protein [Pseudoalteromonas caenipelagi]